MKLEREKSIVDDVSVIDGIIAEELNDGIPEKGVETFKFKGSNPWDLDGWFTKGGSTKYLYLNRPDGFEVTVQRGKHELSDGSILSYWNVYIERNQTDEEGLVPYNQSTTHVFRWVRSLKHAMKLGELGGELMLGLAYPDEYYITQEEWDS